MGDQQPDDKYGGGGYGSGPYGDPAPGYVLQPPGTDEQPEDTYGGGGYGTGPYGDPGASRTLLTELIKLQIKPIGLENLFRHFEGSGDWAPTEDDAPYTPANCTVTYYDDGSQLVQPIDTSLPMFITPALEVQTKPGDYMSVRVNLSYNTAAMYHGVAWVDDDNGPGWSGGDSYGSVPYPEGSTLVELVAHRAPVSISTIGWQGGRARPVIGFAGLPGHDTAAVRIEPNSSQLYASPSQYMVETPVRTGPTQNLTGDTITIVAQRGLNLKGAIDEFTPGILKAIIKGADYDPALNTALRPGSTVWLVGRATPEERWWPVWSGRVLNADVDYDGAEPKITIEATDMLAELANTGAAQSWGPGAGFVSAAQRMRRLLGAYAPRLFWSLSDADSPAAGDGSEVVTDTDTAANFVTQLQRIRDTSRGVAWLTTGDLDVVSAGPPVVVNETIPPYQRLKFYAGNRLAELNTDGHTYVFRGRGPVGAGELPLTGMKLAFSARTLLNSIKVAVRTAGAETVYGPYRNMDSFTMWGPQEDGVQIVVLPIIDIIGGDPIATAAADFLRRFAQPVRYPVMLNVNVTANPGPALTMDLYDRALVQLGDDDADPTFESRILQITHTLTADRKRKERGRWTVQIGTRPEWQTAEVQATLAPVEGA